MYLIIIYTSRQGLITVKGINFDTLGKKCKEYVYESGFNISSGIRTNNNIK